MAEGKYMSVIGIVQKFPDKPVLTKETVNEQPVKKFTFRSATTQALVNVTAWPETNVPDEAIVKGALVAVDGKASKNGEYNNLSANSIVAIPSFALIENPEVVNKKADTESVPF